MMKPTSLTKNGEPIYKCNWCPRWYRKFDNWLSHVLDELHANNSVVCPLCGMVFDTNSKLVKHTTQRVCVWYTDYKCHYCSRKFTTHHEREIHEKQICIPSIIAMIQDDGSNLFNKEYANYLDDQPLLL